MQKTLHTRIIDLLKKGTLKPGILAKKLCISRQALHKHLRLLVEKNSIQKHGTAPHVFYGVSDASTSRVRTDYEYCTKKLLPQYLASFSDSLSKRIQHFTKHGKGDQKSDAFDLGFLLESAAVYSSNIEGNSLDLNSFLNSRMAPKKHRPKEAQEIEDLVEAYRFTQENSLHEQNVLTAHGMLSRNIVSKARQGKYRKEPVGVFSKHGLVYMAIEPQHVEQEMEELFAVLQELLQKKLTIAESFFWASWLHLLMVLIHPFADGNGRISRLCEKWFLVEKIGEQCFFLPSEEQYWKKRPQYYTALKLGANYWETDFGKAFPFFVLLPN